MPPWFKASHVPLALPTAYLRLLAYRPNAFLVIVQALTRGIRAMVTALRYSLIGQAFDKHKIKHVGRLLSNVKFYQERHPIYRALTTQLLQGLSEVISAKRNQFAVPRVNMEHDLFLLISIITALQ